MRIKLTKSALKKMRKLDFLERNKIMQDLRDWEYLINKRLRRK